MHVRIPDTTSRIGLQCSWLSQLLALSIPQRMSTAEFAMAVPALYAGTSAFALAPWWH